MIRDLLYGVDVILLTVYLEPGYGVLTRLRRGKYH